jgi:hypothetical protein
VETKILTTRLFWVVVAVSCSCALCGEEARQRMQSPPVPQEWAHHESGRNMSATYKKLQQLGAMNEEAKVGVDISPASDSLNSGVTIFKNARNCLASARLHRFLYKSDRKLNLKLTYTIDRHCKPAPSSNF